MNVEAVADLWIDLVAAADHGDAEAALFLRTFALFAALAVWEKAHWAMRACRPKPKTGARGEYGQFVAMRRKSE